MNNKFLKLILIASSLVLSAILSACGSTADILPGVGGLGDEQPTPNNQGVEQADAIPTATPIPGTYGHIVFVSNRDGQMSLYMTSPDGVEQIRLTSNLSEDSDPHISPDGTRIAFVSTVDNNTDIYVLDIVSRNITRITDAPEKDSAPSWSPDGTKIAFESFRDGNLEIYMVGADGTNPIRLTDDPAGDSNPVWSPTAANEIVFVSNRFGNADILLLNILGGISTLTTSPAPDSAPAWSPDGSMVAFKTYSGELSDLCIIGRDGLNQRCLTSAPSEYGSPVWSPNGFWVAANAKQSAGYGIDVFNVIDNTVTHLYSPGVEPRNIPTWSPEGARLAFQAESDGDMELYLVTVPTNEFIRLTSIIAYDGEPAWTTQ